jgi:hypothetical protein
MVVWARFFDGGIRVGSGPGAIGERIVRIQHAI